jgi:hypothetical protein
MYWNDFMINIGLAVFWIGATTVLHCLALSPLVGGLLPLCLISSVLVITGFISVSLLAKRIKGQPRHELPEHETSYWDT